MKIKSKKNKSSFNRSVTDAGYLMSRCSSCGKEFRHLSSHRVSCVPKKVEENQPEKFFFPNDIRPHEKKCDMCFMILTKRNFKRHATKDCKVLRLIQMYENGEIDFDRLMFLVEPIRKKNYLRDRCIYCLRRLFDKNMPKHLSNCEGFKQYKKFKNCYHFKKPNKTCQRFEKIKKILYKSKEKYHKRKAEFEEKKVKRFVEKLEEQRNQINPNRSNGLPPISIKKDIDYYLPKQLQDRINVDDSKLHIQALKVSSSQKQPTLSNEEFQKQYNEAMWKNEWNRFKGFKIFQRNPGYIQHHQNKTEQIEFTVVYTSELDGSNIETRHYDFTNKNKFKEMKNDETHLYNYETYESTHLRLQNFDKFK